MARLLNPMETERQFSIKLKVRFKRRIKQVLRLMPVMKIYCSRSIALDSTHVKGDVCIDRVYYFTNIFLNMNLIFSII